jgi:hypothetical protein
MTWAKLALTSESISLPEFSSFGAAAGDFDWVRDRYSASAADRARWNRTLGWARRIARERSRQSSEGVGRFGVRLSPHPTEGCYGDEACQWIIRTERAASGIGTWTDFSTAWAEARPAVAGYLAALGRAEGQMRQALAANSLDSELKIRLLRDQTLRAALSDSGLGLSPNALALFRLVIGLQASRADRANTAWLNGVLGTSGWPGPPAVTADGSRAAWVMVLHARDDPAFRWRVLAMLEAQVGAGRMSRADFATRLDHILWETAGVQRYGTKGNCVGRRFVVERIEDGSKVAALRREAGLPTLEEQERIMAPACAGDVGS